ncbi:CHRNA7 [Mytilus edulis]|uniref:CHRNA7 n=1 Tax=Mytilus edulis TaxID=6550 RepID=A0A8S3VMQ9_MYTED|nr:CHRNA7 [Mytilus edulis]
MILLPFPLPSFGQTLVNVTKLYDDLFSSYRKNIIPVDNHSEPLEISLAFYLLSINSFREIEETLVLTGGLSVVWKDTSLSWNPEDYGNTYLLEVDSTDIWIPWIYLINNAKKFEPIGFDSAFRVFLNSSGFVQYSPGSILEAKCKTDISKFPLDTQPCLLEFIIWNGDAGTYKLISSFDEVNLDYYTKNSNWEVFLLPSLEQTLENVTKLYDDLFSSYRRNIKPVNNHSEPIEISLAFYLLSINSFREIEETLVLTGGLSVVWTDTSLSWNPEDYGNTYSLEVDSTDIWLPWVYLINNAKEFEPVGFDSAFRVFINSSGLVLYSPGSILEAKCQTDISKFPLDTQPCKLEFIIWNGHAGTYKIISSFDEVNLDYYTKNSNWEVVNGDTYAQLDPRGRQRIRTLLLWAVRKKRETTL